MRDHEHETYDATFHFVVFDFIFLSNLHLQVSNNLLLPDFIWISAFGSTLNSLILDHPMNNPIIVSKEMSLLLTLAWFLNQAARISRGTFSSLTLNLFPPAASVFGKDYFFNKKKDFIKIIKLSKRYTCTSIDEYKGKELYYWNTTVSDHCCLYCNNTVYKTDTIIDTIHHEDKCKSIETSTCRRVPGEFWDELETKISYHIT